MCGIAGILARDPMDSGTRYLDALRRMTQALSHRGPDAEGTWTDGPCALGHRRLSIIDLSPDGRQPLTNEDGSIAAVVNGEIYNYVGLRTSLLARGHTFRSRSDSEVVVHLYEEHGSDGIAMLDGMFALALYDARTQRLLLARDRTGKKPLVYRETPHGLAFASELGALVAAFPDARPEVDMASVDEYLALQYVPGPHTIWRDAFKLPAASYALVAPGERPTPRRYWTLPRTPLRDAPLPVLAEELRVLLGAAVERRLMSDVPLGAFLSGGVDSSTIVALMASQSPRAIKTFSIGFPHADDSELRYARMVAARYHTEHHELTVTPDVSTIVTSLVRHHAEPFADSSAVATWCLARMTREHVTVALSGDGSDEIFAGYKRYAPARCAHLHDRAPPLLRPCLRALAEVAMKRVYPPYARFAHAAGASEGERYLHLVGQFSDAEKEAVLGDAVRGAAAGRTRARFDALIAASRGAFPMARLLDVDMATYLVDDIHAKVDISSMAHALEVRCPFLDTAVVEFAARLPMHALMGLRGKRVLRHAVASMVPAEILRRRKRGFALPLERWMRYDLRTMTRDLLLDERARRRGITNATEVARLVDGVDRDPTLADRLWTLLMLEAWFRHAVDGH